MYKDVAKIHFYKDKTDFRCAGNTNVSISNISSPMRRLLVVAVCLVLFFNSCKRHVFMFFQFPEETPLT